MVRLRASLNVCAVVTATASLSCPSALCINCWVPLGFRLYGVTLMCEHCVVAATGGTPNLTDQVRSIPNIEFSAIWWGAPSGKKIMPRAIYETFSPHGQLLCADIVAARGEVIETGYVGPWDKRGRRDNPANSLRLDGKPVAPRL